VYGVQIKGFSQTVCELEEEVQEAENGDEVKGT
jgi:hypothetical protein